MDCSSRGEWSCVEDESVAMGVREKVPGRRGFGTWMVGFVGRDIVDETRIKFWTLSGGVEEGEKHCKAKRRGAMSARLWENHMQAQLLWNA